MPHKCNTVSDVVRVGVGGWESVAAAQFGRVEGAPKLIFQLKNMREVNTSSQIKVNSIDD